MKGTTHSINQLTSIEVKYLGATDTKGSRLRLIDHSQKLSKILTMEYSYSRPIDQVFAYLLSKGAVIIGYSVTKDGDSIHCEWSPTLLNKGL